MKKPEFIRIDDPKDIKYMIGHMRAGMLEPIGFGIPFNQYEEMYMFKRENGKLNAVYCVDRKYFRAFNAAWAHAVCASA